MEIQISQLNGNGFRNRTILLGVLRFCSLKKSALDHFQEKWSDQVLDHGNKRFLVRYKPACNLLCGPAIATGFQDVLACLVDHDRDSSVPRVVQSFRTTDRGIDFLGILPQKKLYGGIVPFGRRLPPHQIPYTFLVTIPIACGKCPAFPRRAILDFYCVSLLTIFPLL